MSFVKYLLICLPYLQHQYKSVVYSYMFTTFFFLLIAYVHRKYNVIAVDWERVSAYPCYLSSISNTKLVAQCTAQLYSFLTFMGTKAKDIVCVGHSLGAHICGMVSNHLTKKQYKIIGNDHHFNYKFLYLQRFIKLIPTVTWA